MKIPVSTMYSEVRYSNYFNLKMKFKRVLVEEKWFLKYNVISRV